MRRRRRRSSTPGHQFLDRCGQARPRFPRPSTSGRFSHARHLLAFEPVKRKSTVNFLGFPSSMVFRRRVFPLSSLFRFPSVRTVNERSGPATRESSQVSELGREPREWPPVRTLCSEGIDFVRARSRISGGSWYSGASGAREVSTSRAGTKRQTKLVILCKRCCVLGGKRGKRLQIEIASVFAPRRSWILLPLFLLVSVWFPNKRMRTFFGTLARRESCEFLERNRIERKRGGGE